MRQRRTNPLHATERLLLYGFISVLFSWLGVQLPARVGACGSPTTMRPPGPTAATARPIAATPAVGIRYAYALRGAKGGADRATTANPRQGPPVTADPRPDTVFVPLLFQGPEPAAPSAAAALARTPVYIPAEPTPERATTEAAVAPTPDGQRREAVVPILMYHHIGQPQPGWDRIRRGLTVSEESFRWQLGYLRRNGYESLALADLIAYLANGRPLPEGRRVVITFDDGYRDNYELALPILKEYGFTATFFLVTEPIDRGSPEFLTWQQVKEMHAEGMQFGAHSYTHPDLRDQPVDYVIWQVVGSREAIEARIEEPARFFAYPSGAYDDQVIAVLKSAGFWGAMSTSFGCKHSSDDVWTLARVRVSPQDNEGSFAEKLGACPSS